ncbi:MAG: protein translocase subunit SecF [Bryobacterales bacterium]|nr:protein translocase subunit SecF [Bryobacterales bacterium]
MELFHNTNFDFLGKKWIFISISLALMTISVISLVVHGGPEYGIDFRGGTLMYVRFAQRPPIEKIRSVLGKKISGEITVQEITGANQVMIGTDIKSEKALNQERDTMQQTLGAAFGNPASGKLDFNNASGSALADRLRDPLSAAGVPMSEPQLQALVKALLDYRDTPPNSGLVASIGKLGAVPGVTPAILNVLQQQLYPASYAIKSVEIVGPKVGAELQHQALLAILYALGGMLIYIAFRFEWIYGVAAVLAVFHDTVVTIGLFSIFHKEITLTVVAALLTLVGYSMNDTIVVFDRIRENLKILRRERFEALVNLSVNQTLSRTVLTSGLTFLTAFSLLLFGGPVLHGFSFALVVGIVIGTYSSIFVASPILILWQNYVENRKRVSPAASPAASRTSARKGSPKPVK